MDGRPGDGFDSAVGTQPPRAQPSSNQNTLCPENARHLENWTYGVRDPFGPVLEKQVRTREFTGGKVVVVIFPRDLCLYAPLT